jgi:predicted negative regulator of RcsB-dependent stress response
VVLANNTDLPKQNVSLTFYVEGLMDSPTQQQSKPLQAFSNTTIPLSAVFNESILEKTEKQKVQGQLTLTYRQDGTEETVERSLSFTLYGRNSIKWKDKRRLAAFVAPRNQEMIDFTKAVDQMFSDQPTFNLPSKVITATQLYTTLNRQGYTYSVDPQTDFSVVSRNPEMLDYCQYPVQTMKRKGGDCDDLVALYLSALANAGVSVAYVDIPGHVMSAFDAGLSPEELRGSGLSRDRVIVENDRVWIPVETTLLGSKPFMTAWQQGIERYREEQEAGTLPEIVSLAEARDVYEPSSLALPDFSPSLPSDTAAVLTSYRDQASTLYARKTRSERRQLRQRLKEQPGNTIARNQLGILLARSGKLDEALALYEDGLERLPSSSLLLNNYGNVLYQKGNYEKAIEVYNKSLNVGSSDPQVYINLCKAQLALGRLDNAASSFQSAIDQDPSLADTYSYLQDKL